MASPTLRTDSAFTRVSFNYTVAWRRFLTDGSLMDCAVGFHTEENARSFYDRLMADGERIESKTLLRGDYVAGRLWDSGAVIEST